MVSKDPSWFEHVDLMQVCLVVALAWICWFIRRLVVSVETGIADLYAKYNGMSKDLYELIGEHKGRRSSDKGGSC